MDFRFYILDFRFAECLRRKFPWTAQRKICQTLSGKLFGRRMSDVGCRMSPLQGSNFYSLFRRALPYANESRPFRAENAHTHNIARTKVAQVFRPVFNKFFETRRCPLRAYLLGSSFKTRMIYRARYSFISLWRGIGWLTNVIGFLYQSCLLPCRTKTHPAASNSRMRSRHFMQVAVPRPVEHSGQARREHRHKCPSGFQSVLRANSLVSCSRDNLQDTPTTHPHLANRCNELNSCLQSTIGFYFLQAGQLNND